MESFSLFSNEKLHLTKGKVIECLNEIALAESAQIKCENIAKVQEMILHTEKDLCDEFLENVLALSQDRNADVRKSVAVFIEEACRVDNSILPKVDDVLLVLLRDNSPQVVKKVIQAASVILKNTLRYLSTFTGTSTDIDGIEQSWNKLCLLKAQILDMLDNENDGIRTNAIKFLESVIIYQTNREETSIPANEFSLDDIPSTLKMFKKKKVIEDEALNIFDQLIKFHGASHISSVNLIACTGSLCAIAKQRPSLMVPVIEALKNVHYNLPPTLTDSQVSSVRKHFKIQFLGLLKHPAIGELQQQLIQILEDLGCSDELKKMSLILSRGSKRALDNNSESITHKRQKQKNDPVASIDYVTEGFLKEKLANVENVVSLVIDALKHVPEKVPQSFIAEYIPLGEMTINEQIQKISKLLVVQAEAKRFKSAEADATNEAGVSGMEIGIEEGKEEFSTENNAAKRLRETLERVKGLDKGSRSKQKVVPMKTLPEITKGLSKTTKQQLLNSAVGRILKHKNNIKQTKILTVFGSTFLPSVKTLVLNSILDDLVNNQTLAFSWLFEEYSLIQGFVRHSYNNKTGGTDSVYNELLVSFIKSSLKRENVKEQKQLLESLFLFSPCITDEAVGILKEICKIEPLSAFALNICKEMIEKKPPKVTTFLNILLELSVNEHTLVREQAIEKIILLHEQHSSLNNKIESFALVLLGYLQLETPPLNIFEEKDVWTEELTRICLRLPMELLPSKNDLLHSLAATYVHATSDIKRTILRVVESPVRKLGQNNVEILKLIDNCVSGSETLVTRIIHILTEKSVPSADLVSRIKKLHETKVSDVRLLIPILCGLSKKELLSALPKFLKLNPNVVKEVFNRLLSSETAPLTPIELLVALHTLDPAEVEIKFVVKATSLCLQERDVYTHEVLAAVLQQLVDITPFPTLLMRTVIQSLSLYSKLSGFVINLLQRLVLKQVWKQKVVWDGFLKCCQRLIPASLGVLMQLPVAQMEDALKSCPELKEPLTEYAKSVSEKNLGITSNQIVKLLLSSSENSEELDNQDLLEQPQNSVIEPAPPGME